MIASFHLADVGKLAGLRLLRRSPTPRDIPGLHYAALTTCAPLSEHLLPRPDAGRVALIAAWDDDTALDRFLDADPLANAMRGGWHTRLQPTHIFGAWPALEGLVGGTERPMADGEPAAALTIGRLRLSQTPRFLKASAAAERLAVRDPAMLRGTGFARPPLVATFSLWQTTGAMRAYAGGPTGSEHRDAVKAHAARPFHHASAFIRFRPYGAEGEWDGENPLADAQPAPAPLA